MPLRDPESYRDVDLPTILRMERRLPWYGWPHLPLGLLVCVSAILAAYRVPVSFHLTTALVAGSGVVGGFSGYGCGLVMVSTPDLVQTGYLHWRRTRMLRLLLIVLGALSAASMIVVVTCHIVLLSGSEGRHPFTLSPQAGLYLLLVVANTVLAGLEAWQLSMVLRRPVTETGPEPAGPVQVRLG
ncbi:hypothetical protein [Amycolatopsis jiangsuensis]|uniref:Uncharacterized protein n=1 Tax=Amycolatopsis jiangsuensis TaxID=1181879 RepID=A0A840IYC6_9PSEU|nr:hypothetical protein [Amycolatopsis jiangsuensis]MBB4687861.1 hypothetical protein [Amycolatopsis jiangsuensis]